MSSLPNVRSNHYYAREPPPPSIEPHFREWVGLTHCPVLFEHAEIRSLKTFVPFIPAFDPLPNQQKVVPQGL